MKILLTNDDGIDAPGMAALADSVAAALQDTRLAAISATKGGAHQIVIAAPDRGRSECGHGVTLTRPLRIEQRGDDRFAIDGTPVDCVRAFLTQEPFDAVISGVNAGANLGIDLLVSGTFAAAREAAGLGVPAMAISHYRHPNVVKSWEHVPDWLADVLVAFISHAATDRGSEMLWNVNLPAVDPDGPRPGSVECDVDTTPHARTAILESGMLRFELNFQQRPHQTGTDVAECFGGKITISRLKFAVV